MKRTTLNSLLPLFFVIVIDGMGFGMTIPVLTPLLNKTTSNILGNHESEYLRHLVYGFVMFIPPLAYFFGAPLIGYLSDRYGRKKILAWCLIGTFLSYLLYVVSFRLSSLIILIFARLIGGFTTGSQAVAQAAMADISTQQSKVLNIGTIALAMTIGLLAGPLMGGILSNANYASWFSTLTPFYTAALLALLNFLLLFFLLHETHVKQTIKLTSFTKNLTVFLGKTKNLHLLLVFFWFELGWSMYYQGIAVTAVEKFHLGSAMLAYFVTYIGLALSFGLIFILRLVTPYFSLRKIILTSLLVGFISLLLAFFSHHLWTQVLIALPITFMVATCYSSLITLLSNNNDSAVQGLVMGTSDAALSLAFAITGFLSGWITYYNAMLPLLFASFFMLSGLITHFACTLKPKQQDTACEKPG